jgi:hypothetical protein
MFGSNKKPHCVITPPAVVNKNNPHVAARAVVRNNVVCERDARLIDNEGRISIDERRTKETHAT